MIRINLNKTQDGHLKGDLFINVRCKVARLTNHPWTTALSHAHRLRWDVGDNNIIDMVPEVLL